MIDPQRQAFIEAVEMIYGLGDDGKGARLTRVQVNDIIKDKNLPFPYWLVTSEFKDPLVRGRWIVPSLVERIDALAAAPTADTAELNQLAILFNGPTDDTPSAAPRAPTGLSDDNVNMIPNIHYGYVPFGFFGKMKQIIESGRFFPVFVTGDSGEGKTLMTQQVCAILERELIVVSVSIETDQNDLLGGPTLFNGNIIDREGPVLTAMRRGAILMLDEVDRGSNKLICLHAILDGQPYFNKNTGELIYPAPGFNVVATANTKGRGSDDGKYLSQILDHAFLERFPITIEQENPPPDIQKKQLDFVLNRAGMPDDDFSAKLVRWASLIRTSYKDEGSIDEQISTRRLIQICETYGIFRDRILAINLCVNRFDAANKKAFLDFYQTIDDTIMKGST